MKFQSVKISANNSDVKYANLRIKECANQYPRLAKRNVRVRDSCVYCENNSFKDLRIEESFEHFGNKKNNLRVFNEMPRFQKDVKGNF